MADTDTQIKDSILSTNEIMLGSSTSKAMATMYLNLAHSAGMASMNAVTNQQHLNILGSAAIAAGASGLLRTGLSDQIDRMTPDQRLDYLQKLLSLSATADSAAAEASSQSAATPPAEGSASAAENTSAAEPATSPAVPAASTTGTPAVPPAPTAKP
jgi:hypothetical protein